MYGNLYSIPFPRGFRFVAGYDSSFPPELTADCSMLVIYNILHS